MKAHFSALSNYWRSLAQGGHGKWPVAAVWMRILCGASLAKARVPPHAVVAKEEGCVRFVVGAVEEARDAVGALEHQFLRKKRRRNSCN